MDTHLHKLFLHKRRILNMKGQKYLHLMKESGRKKKPSLLDESHHSSQRGLQAWWTEHLFSNKLIFSIFIHRSNTWIQNLQLKKRWEYHNDLISFVVTVTNLISAAKQREISVVCCCKIEPSEIVNGAWNSALIIRHPSETAASVLLKPVQALWLHLRSLLTAAAREKWL